MIYLGTEEYASADIPLNRVPTPSCLTIFRRQSLALTYVWLPPCLSVLMVWRRTLTVSRGWPITREAKPPTPPARRLAAGSCLFISGVKWSKQHVSLLSSCYLGYGLLYCNSSLFHNICNSVLYKSASYTVHYTLHCTVY